MSVDATTERRARGRHDTRSVIAAVAACTFPDNRHPMVITHRMVLAAAADRVLVLGSTGIVEQGRPAELQARGGAFAELFG